MVMLSIGMIHTCYMCFATIFDDVENPSRSFGSLASLWELQGCQKGVIIELAIDVDGF